MIAVACLALVPAGLLAQAGKPKPKPSPDGGTVVVGQAVSGALRNSDALLPTDSTYAQEWKLDGHAGQIVTIDVASDSFDAYVFLFGPGIGGDLPQDDDSGGHCNARLTVRLPESGAYHVAVTSTGKFATGPFTLTVSAGAKPKSLARCER